MTIDEIRELAARYVERADMVDIPGPGELFYLEQTTAGDDDAAPLFGGYGIVHSYTADPAAEPRGKWIIMRYFSLAAVPPQETEIRLQPPHIALGRFQTPDRTARISIVPCSLFADDHDTEENVEEDQGATSFLDFPGGNKKR
ncbi:MAG: hypothetical protein ACQEQV_07405 [Fibrobacterota bacterium]